MPGGAQQQQADLRVIVVTYLTKLSVGPKIELLPPANTHKSGFSFDRNRWLTEASRGTPHG